MTKLTIGADPEFFLKKDGLNVSAHGFTNLFGDKKSPQKVPGGAIQVDGTALEFNIDPADCETTFVRNIRQVLGTLRHEVPEEFQFAFQPTARYTEEVFQDIPFFARVLGCDPDFNAWTGLVNPAPDATNTMRTAAGHIHLGYDQKDDTEFGQQLVQQLDSVLYPMSMFWDEDDTRMEMYGKPGAFRYKGYGIEYRTLSNAWLQEESLMRTVYRAAHKAYELFVDGLFIPDKFGYTPDAVNRDNFKGYYTNVLEPLGMEFV
jgi:hypothetical protein